MPILRLSTTRRLRLVSLVLLISVVTPGCNDPKKEAELRWREEEVNAKVANVALREQAIAAKLNEVEGEKIALKQREAKITIREQELAKLEEAVRRAKVEYETKARRGPAPSVSAERILVIDPALPDVPLFERAAGKRGAIASTTKS